MKNTTSPSANTFDVPISSIAYSVVWSACIAAILGLPWLFPPTTVVASDSYNVGFSNRVCVLCVWLAVALLTALKAMNRHRARTTGLTELLNDTARHPVRIVPPPLPCALAACLCLAQWLWYLILPNITYGDMYEYVNKIDMVLLHRIPGRDFFWSYGPLYLDVPAALVRLTGNSLDSATAYVISLLLFTVIGLWMLWYLCELVASTHQRALLMFGTFALAGANLSMGSSYTLIRFVYPYATLLFLHRMAAGDPGQKNNLRPWHLPVITAVLLVLGLSISPEIGAALGAALAVYYLLSWASTGNNDFSRSLVLALLAAAAYLLLIPGSLDSLKTFGSGAWIFPVYPSFYTVAYLATILCVVPRLLAHGWMVRDRALACGLATVILVLVPAALGRCDPGHIFLYGLGVFLIGLAWAQHAPAPRFAWALCGFAAFYSIGLPVAFGVGYGPQLRDTIIAWRAGQRKPDRNWLRASSDPAQAQLEHKVAQVFKGYGKIGTPFDRDEQMDIFLKREDLYVPEYYISESDVALGTPAQLARKIDDISHMHALLFPVDLEHPTFDRKAYEAHQAEYFSKMFLVPVHYQLLHMPYFPVFEAADYVRRHYVPAVQLGPYLLMVRRDAGKK